MLFKIVTLLKKKCIIFNFLNSRDRVRVIVFNAIFNNISVISWWSVVPLKKTTDPPQVTDKLYHIMLC